MNKPRLIVVTGRPGAGKTTLAEKLSREWCLPLVSRDRIKEGYVHTAGKSHDDLPETANLHATQIFFEALAFFADRGISTIAEAAFQHAVWQAGLQPLKDRAIISLLVCRTDAQTALDRFLRRGLADERRGWFHGDKGVQMLREGHAPVPGPYVEPELDVQTIAVDTTCAYSPDPETIHRAIFSNQRPDKPLNF